MADLACLTASMTVPATLITALRAKPTITEPPSESAVKPVAGEGPVYCGRKVITGQVLNARPADGADGENIVLYESSGFWIQFVVMIVMDPGKTANSLCLVLPGGPVVCGEMRYFFRSGNRVSGAFRHAYKRRSPCLGLFEDRLEVLEVVPWRRVWPFLFRP